MRKEKLKESSKFLSSFSVVEKVLKLPISEQKPVILVSA
jgi:hypothetical protein